MAAPEGGLVEIELEIPGRWDAVPSVPGATIQQRPRRPGLRDDYQRRSGGSLGGADLDALDRHAVVLRVRGEGGSPGAAYALVAAGARLLATGGAAVRVMASDVVHGKDVWLALAERRSLPASIHAYVALRSDGTTTASAGMRALGSPDAVVTSAPGEQSTASSVLTGFLVYSLASETAVAAGDIFCLSSSPVYRIDQEPSSPADAIGSWHLSAAGPIPVAGLTEVVAVSAGGGHGLALRADGSVWRWGVNHGSGYTGAPTHYDRPVALRGLPPSGAVAVSAGGQHSLVLLAEGTVMSFGANFQGALGDGTTQASDTPVPVAGLAGVVAVSAGTDHSLALLADGSVAGWGSPTHGRLGPGSGSENRLTPAVVRLDRAVTAVAAGGAQSLFLLADGSVLRWGASPPDWRPGQDVVALPGPALAIAASSHGLAVLQGGSVAAWGSNFLGQLGDGTRTDRADPIGVPLPGRALAVGAGYQHSVALLEDGRVVEWGHPLGEPTPVAISGVVALSAGGTLTLALKGDGSVAAWGSNLGGQLGAARSHVGPSPGALEAPPITSRAKASLESLAQVSVRLWGAPGSDARVGGTKLGGAPDLADDVPWPVFEGSAGLFVGQIDLAEILSAMRVLQPEVGAGDGLLSFFCDPEFRGDGISPDGVACSVTLTEAGTPLVRRPFPESLAAHDRFKELPLRPDAEVMQVPVEAWEVERLALTRDEYGAWAEQQWARKEEDDRPRHRTFGYPEPVQNELRRWTDELLLLQVDSDDDAGMMWSDVGRLYFLARVDDLEADRFDRVRLVHQSS